MAEIFGVLLEQVLLAEQALPDGGHVQLERDPRIPRAREAQRLEVRARLYEIERCARRDPRAVAAGR